MCKKDCLTSLPAKDGGKRIRNRVVDHIESIVDQQRCLLPRFVLYLLFVEERT